MSRTVLIVDSLADEQRSLGKCDCGGTWNLLMEDVVPLESRWYDALVVRCDRCGTVDRALFDITAFFEPKGLAWSR